MTTATVNVSFPKSLLKRMDRVARQESRSRSELLREAARAYVERKLRWANIFAGWHKIAQQGGVTPHHIEEAIGHVRRRQHRS